MFYIAFLLYLAGASIYFSHSLQLLFLSYTGGINLVAYLNEDFSGLNHMMPILFKDSTIPMTLCEWTESYLQPGFICALSRTTFSPVMLFLQANIISIVDLKTDPSKSKVVGIALDVKIKDSSFGGRTSLILLIEDGSLRVHNIMVDKIQSWQTYDMSVSSPLVNFRRKWKTKDLGRSKLPIFSVDFFESCSLYDDIDFGGLDVLHVYNQTQIKNR
ncbi:E3 ubiquitin-protein ligase UBR4 [Oopsacas minuta]|uniref:E3 ubiquitin-protein ligase UBR4 n=1 Tax=Oopsacas minuta TaxID=111878 RepID=A0AAV7JZ33_9METZ|nr:E3 ubiquitin-protein ligase UBR4 [Oopsacas minuta]